MSVVQQAYVCRVSTRRVDQLVESLGLRISRFEVSRIWAGLDEQVEAYRRRRSRAATPNNPRRLCTPEPNRRSKIWCEKGYDRSNPHFAPRLPDFP